MTTDDLQQPRKMHLVKTPYAGIWSMIRTSSGLAPKPRTGYFWCEWTAHNSAVIGCGKGEYGKSLNDVWFLNLGTYKWTPFELNGVEISARSCAQATIVEKVVHFRRRTGINP